MRQIAALLVLLLAGAMTWAGEPHSSYLGVDVDDVTPERVQALKLKSLTGVEITMVDSDAPAGKAGLKEHDVILQFNGNSVESVEELRRLIRETPAGRTVQLTISRDGNQQTLPVTLGDRAKVMTWTPSAPRVPDVPRVVIPPIHIETPDVPVIVSMTANSRAGLLVESLTPQLGEYFGVKGGEGALVRQVEKGSPAEVAGLKAGDVIVKIDQQKVVDRGDVRQLLRNKSGKVPVVILRDKREQTVTLTLPDRKQSSNGRSIIISPEDFDFDFDQMADMIPDSFELALAQGTAELAKRKTEIKKEMEEAKREMKREVERHKHEMKQQQKEIEKERKESEKQQLEDDDNE